jgi:hypothetical protein
VTVTPPRVVILSATMATARRVADERALKPGEWVWPRRRSDLNGMRPAEVIVAPSFGSHKAWDGLADWFALESNLRRPGFVVTH